MCTAITYQTNDFYFGRTLDLDESYGEEITITPRKLPFSFRHLPALASHHAIIGMAHVSDGYPLYYDAVNEKGLAMAALHFEGLAQYASPVPGRSNVASFELIPWVLGQWESVEQALPALRKMTVVNTPFSKTLPPTPMHWLLADRHRCVTLECAGDTMLIYDNPVGVLTNAPEFPQQLFLLNNYQHLTPAPPENRLAPDLPLGIYSAGMGAIGLPGDLSSQSRFVRGVFTKFFSVSGPSDEESVGQFFHILDAVSQPRGCCRLKDGGLEHTIYASCCNTIQGIYYYTTYSNRQITAVHLHREQLDGQSLIRFPLVNTQQIRTEN